jgi:hypothetical protein
MPSIEASCRRLLLAALLGIGVVLGGVAHAQSTAPVTATCKDGTSYSGKSKRGACAHHGGVKSFDVAGAAETAAPPAAKPAPAPIPPPAAKPPKTPKVATSSGSGQSAGSPQVARSSQVARPAPPAGTDQVWVNTASKVYHCPGTRYHGNTKSGEYMSEAAAKAKGYRPSRGKECG